MTWLQNAEFYTLLLGGSKINVCLFVYFFCRSILFYIFCCSQVYKCCASISPVLLLKVCTIWPRLYCCWFFSFSFWWMMLSIITCFSSILISCSRNWLFHSFKYFPLVVFSWFCKDYFATATSNIYFSKYVFIWNRVISLSLISFYFQLLPACPPKSPMSLPPY